MATSQNGYIANDQSRTQVWTIPGTKRTVRLRKGSPGELLTLIAARFHKEVEDIEAGIFDDWGYAERPIRGSTTTLSNHASGTAIDLNATKHPLGVPISRTFTPTQIARIRAIVKDFDGCIRWGGEWSRPDGMHFEINASVEKCDATLKKLKTPEEDMPLTDAELDKIVNRLKPVITAAAEAEGAKTRATIHNLVGDVVDSDPAVWGDAANNTKVKASTALARILDALGKEQSQPGQ